ncbi:helix-turn-helix domain-containing protein [Candidatus Bathyarchaeota archaeon A05DMB-2]|nr:helix-turn-helix domain-containing protein [Candidatus Bathyarchaeota archaeon A05DMB-2]
MEQLALDESTQLLNELGLTETQTKLYLSLLKNGSADAKTLASHSGIPRTAVYRVLHELQQKGLVEQEIALPNKFQATPIRPGLQILMTQKLEEHRKIEKKAKEFLQRFQENEEEAAQAQEYKFLIIDGKERQIQKMRRQNDSAQRSVDVLSTLNWWLQIINVCFENYEKALNRHVKYRTIIEKTKTDASFPKEVHALLSKPNFKLKLIQRPLDTNAAVFDRREATFNFYPSKSLAESHFIWTNHPSFIAMCQSHFERLWKQAQEYKLD